MEYNLSSQLAGMVFLPATVGRALQGKERRSAVLTGSQSPLAYSIANL
jgi:hypothetical protein